MLDEQEIYDELMEEVALSFHSEMQETNASKAARKPNDLRSRLMAERDQLRKKGQKIGILSRLIAPSGQARIEPFEEAVVNMNEILSVEFLEIGLHAKKPVGKIVTSIGKTGTGFLVGQDVIMTNHHVIPSCQVIENDDAQFILNYESQKYGQAKPERSFYFDPERLFYTNKYLDFTLIAVRDYEAGDTNKNQICSVFGWHRLRSESEELSPGKAVSIIHHPLGQRKSITMHNSSVIPISEQRNAAYCWYVGDTEPGSSGSPVFDMHWRVVALHHMSVPSIVGQSYETAEGASIPIKTFRKMSVEQRPNLRYIANEGIRLSAILDDLKIAADAHPEIAEIVSIWNKKGPKYPFIK